MKGSERICLMREPVRNKKKGRSDSLLAQPSMANMDIAADRPFRHIMGAGRKFIVMNANGPSQSTHGSAVVVVEVVSWRRQAWKLVACPVGESPCVSCGEEQRQRWSETAVVLLGCQHAASEARDVIAQ